MSAAKHDLLLSIFEALPPTVCEEMLLNRTGCKLAVLQVRGAATCADWRSLGAPFIVSSLRCPHRRRAAGARRCHMRRLALAWRAVAGAHSPLPSLQACKGLRAHLGSLRLGVGLKVLPRQDRAIIEDGLARLLLVCEVRSLDISMLRYYEHGVRIPFVDLTSAVLQCTGLERLNLWGRYLSELHIEQLSAVVQRCPLRELNLASNQLAKSEAVRLCTVLAPLPLVSLDLSDNFLDASSMRALGPFLRTRTTLSELLLENNPLGADGLSRLACELEPRSTWPCLSTLNLCHVYMRDTGAAALAPLLLELVALQELYLGSNGMRDEGVAELAPALASLGRLRVLDLARNELGASSAAWLGDVLRACTELAKLCVNMNEFKDAGVASMKTSWSLNGPLVRLDMRSNGLSAQGLAMLADVLSRYDKLTDLDLSHNYVPGRSGCEVLADCFAQLTGLERLTVRHCGLSKCNMDMLAHQLERFTALACLDLGGNHVWGRSTKVLARALGTCTTLRELGLEDVKFGPYGMRHLAQSLVRCTGLERLNVAGNRIGQAGVGQLVRVVGRCKRLRELNVSRNLFDEKAAVVLFRCLCKCPELQTLDASRNPWGPKVVKRWAPLLAQAATLLSLNLMRCEMGNDGAAALAAWLPHSGPLCMLDLSFNSITAAGAVALAKALPSCASLARLHMTGNFVGREGHSAIMQHAPARLALRL